MQCYTQLTPPTAVTNSLSLPFLSPSANNLIVAKTSLLQIFSVKSIITNASTPFDIPSVLVKDLTAPEGQNNTQTPVLRSDQSVQGVERAHTTKLVLVAQYDLSGTITSLARVKILHTKSGGEAILVALRDAKLSLVEWDPERYTIATISIHMYEQEIIRSPWEPDLGKTVSHLSVDPSSRCAALKYSEKHVAIIPFRQARDDLVMDDYDPEFDSGLDQTVSPTKAENEGKAKEKSPYDSSFTLSLLALDPSLSHPLHFVFLHEYREPTIGILSSHLANSVALQSERRDTLSYTVFTLDLEQRASTTLLSVNKLPNDLFSLIPLPLPVGGALLVGINALIHVDQAGKTNGVAVNSFAKTSTSFALSDQADLHLRLEYCVIEQLGPDNRELLIILNNGELAILTFKIDGRSVSGLSVRRTDLHHGGNVVLAGASCASLIGRGRMFVGSERADSIILGWSRKSDKAKRQKPRATIDDNDSYDPPLELEEDDIEDDEDDLYSPTLPDDKASAAALLPLTDENGDYIFRVHDSLQNVGPMRDIALRKRPETQDGQNSGESTRLELMATGGCGKAGGLTNFQRDIEPNLVEDYDISDADCIWSVSARLISKGSTAKAANGQSEIEQDKYIIASRIGNTGKDHLIAYKLVSLGLQEVTNTEFDPDAGGTIEVGTLNNGTRIVLVSQSEVRTFDAVWLGEVFMPTVRCGRSLLVYNNSFATITRKFLSCLQSIASIKKIINVSDQLPTCTYVPVVNAVMGTFANRQEDLGLVQIFPMTDDATGAEPQVISAHFSDPYLLLIRDEQSLMVLRVEENGDLDEVERGAGVLENKWISGSLYEDSNDVLRLEESAGSDDSDDDVGNVLVFLLSNGGGLQIYRLPNLTKPIYVADGLSFLPPFLSPEFTVRRSSAREILAEIMVAELGDAVHKSPFLIVRSEDNQLYVYQPYHSPSQERGQDKTLRFLKITTSYLPSVAPDEAYKDEEEKAGKPMRPLRVIQDLDNYSTVFMPGESPSFIIKSASTPPFLIRMRSGPIRGLSRLDIPKCEKGFIFIDDEGSAHSAKLPSESSYCTGWVTRRIHLGEEVQYLDYHQAQDSYVLALSRMTDFKLGVDEKSQEPAKEDTTLVPQIEQGSIQLLDRKTWSVIDSRELDHGEVIMCIKTMSLEVSEQTHERQDLVVVGTTVIRGEDLPQIGRVYIFAIIDVVPEPGIPQTGRKFKLIIKEELKGAVTAVSPIGSQGFLMVAQGQKCLVRGLKEDGTLLPVAFIDMQCYVTVVKELKGTGMCLMADAIKGVWLTGYYEEPYQIRLFSKSPQHIEAIAADFLPDGKQLYIIVADADSNIHILQFDPDHPKSLSGTRLLHHTTFHTGHYPSTLTLLLSSSSSPAYQLLLTSATGSLALITPLSTSIYRTLAALQAHLQNTLPQPLGCNPRGYRGGGGVIDGGVLRRWGEGGSWKRWDGRGEEGVEEILGGLWRGGGRF